MTKSNQAVKKINLKRIFYEVEKAHKNVDYDSVIEHTKDLENRIGFDNIEDPVLYSIVFYLFYSFRQTDQPEKALSLYGKLVNTTANYLITENYEILLKLSAFYYFLKRHEDAVNVLTKAEKLYPNDFKISYAFGIHLFENQKFKNAELKFEIANNIQPKNTDVMLYLGKTYHENSKFHEAIKILMEADKIKPNDVSILAALGTAFWELGMSVEAEKSFKTANELFPTDLNLFENLSKAYIQNNKYHAAEDVLTKARALFPDNFAVLSLLNTVHEKKKHLV